jgi:hypothetical protein
MLAREELDRKDEERGPVFMCKSLSRAFVEGGRGEIVCHSFKSETVLSYLSLSTDSSRNPDN